VPEKLKSIPVVGERIYDQLTLLAGDKDQLTRSRSGCSSRPAALGRHC